MEVESDNKSTYDCDQVNIKHGYDEEYFWISGILLVIVGTSGLVSGNTFTMVIFCQRQMRKNLFYNLLFSSTGLLRYSLHPELWNNSFILESCLQP